MNVDNPCCLPFKIARRILPVRLSWSSTRYCKYCWALFSLNGISWPDLSRIFKFFSAKKGKSYLSLLCVSVSQKRRDLVELLFHQVELLDHRVVHIRVLAPGCRRRLVCQRLVARGAHLWRERLALRIADRRQNATHVMVRFAKRTNHLVFLVLQNSTHQFLRFNIGHLLRAGDVMVGHDYRHEYGDKEIADVGAERVFAEWLDDTLLCMFVRRT